MIRATLPQTTHFTLQKNYLAQNKAASPQEIAETLAGLPLASAQQALFARLKDYSAAPFPDTLIQTPFVRNEIHLIPAEKYPAYFVATQRQRRQHFNVQFINWGVDPADIETLGHEILSALGNNSASVDEISSLLPAEKAQTLSQTTRGGRALEKSAVALTLEWLVGLGKLAVQANRYAPFSVWYPQIDLNHLPDEAKAQADLCRDFLSAYGPVTEADISAWTGFGKSETARAVSALSAETVLTMVGGIPGALLMLKTQGDALRQTPEPSAPIINFLPAHDPYPKAYTASRSRLLSNPATQKYVLKGQPLILLNGLVIGTWAWENKLSWQLEAEIGDTTMNLLQQEAERLSDWFLAK